MDDSDKIFIPLTCIKNLIGKYEINRLGEIKTISSGRIRSRKDYKINKGGYPFASLGSHSTYIYLAPIHILLAKTFIPNPDNKPIVDHIDKNRENYSLSNLRWVTYSENNKNRTPNGKKNRYFIKLDDNKNEIEKYLLTIYLENKKQI